MIQDHDYSTEPPVNLNSADFNLPSHIMPISPGNTVNTNEVPNATFVIPSPIHPGSYIDSQPSSQSSWRSPSPPSPVHPRQKPQSSLQRSPLRSPRSPLRYHSQTSSSIQSSASNNTRSRTPTPIPNPIDPFQAEIHALRRDVGDIHDALLELESFQSQISQSMHDQFARDANARYYSLFEYHFDKDGIKYKIFKSKKPLNGWSWLRFREKAYLTLMGYNNEAKQFHCKCPQCPKQLFSPERETIFNHILKVNNIRFKCIECDKLMTHEKEMETHICSQSAPFKNLPQNSAKTRHFHIDKITGKNMNAM